MGVGVIGWDRRATIAADIDIGSDPHWVTSQDLASVYMYFVEVIESASVEGVEGRLGGVGGQLQPELDGFLNI